MNPSDAAAKAAILTDAQRRYLRLVAEGRTSKQIAQEVGGSHHTVNVQIGAAMRVLGAASRRQAAAMVGAADRTGSYEPSYEPPAIAPSLAGGQAAPRHDHARDEQPWPIPIATAARPTNSLSVAQRLAWILVIAAAVALLLGGVVSGVTTMLVTFGSYV